MSDSVLESIDSPIDLRRLDEKELVQLAGEIRDLIIATTSSTGGHLASSLGAVEIAIAVHRALDTPRDLVIWDVGHQAYAHKILTGRRDRFPTLRQYGGIDGFPRRGESEYDVVDSGHAGSSISFGLGLAIAREIFGEDHKIAVVIGDGSMTSGVAYEAMNQAGHHLNSNLIIILNDNGMSISGNVGGFSSYLSRIRLKPGYTHLKDEFEEFLRTVPAVGDGMVRLAAQLKETITHALVPGALFESLGLKYVGPIDGHDIGLLEETIAQAGEVSTPVLIHVITQKGKGYDYSERKPEEFHGVHSFDSTTGKMPKSRGKVQTYSGIFGETCVELAREKPGLVAITAAMKLGTGLSRFEEVFPERFFDVGIAEQSAVTIAGGLALGGLQPVVAIYSTFLQRAFDQLSQEICLQKLPVVFVVDRAGLVGEDGSTHHGYFDITYLRLLPNMTVMAPSCGDELPGMLRFALDLGSPVAIRFPRGSIAEIGGSGASSLMLGRGEVLRSGDDIVIFALGDMVSRALETSEILAGADVQATVVNARFAKPLDPEFLIEATDKKKLVVTMENNIVTGGFGGAVLESMDELGVSVPVLIKGLPDRYVEHGTIEELIEEVGLSASKMAVEIKAKLSCQA